MHTAGGAEHALAQTGVEQLKIVFNDTIQFIISTAKDAGDAMETIFSKIADGIEAVANDVYEAIKRVIEGGPSGLVLDDLLDSIRQEFREHEDLPNTTNPDDWAKISGKKGERIVFIRTLVGNDDAQKSTGGRAIERVQTGQYL